MNQLIAAVDELKCKVEVDISQDQLNVCTISATVVPETAGQLDLNVVAAELRKNPAFANVFYEPDLHNALQVKASGSMSLILHGSAKGFIAGAKNEDDLFAFLLDLQMALMDILK